MSDIVVQDEKKVDDDGSYRQFNRHVLCWIDLELTGLDYAKDTIVEIAVILTDIRLKRKTVGPNVVIKTSPSQLSPWCTETFQTNGLYEAMQEATSDVRDAERKVLDFLKAHIAGPGIANLAGSSVHVDRIFLIKHMPKIIDFLHYRIVDVSSLNICAWSWCPNRMRNGQSKSSDWNVEDANSDDDAPDAQAEDSVSPYEPNAHRAKWDLEQSILALRFLRDEIYRTEISKSDAPQDKSSSTHPLPRPAKRPTKSKTKKPRF